MDLFFATGGELVKHTGGISKGADSSPQPKQTNQQLVHTAAFIISFFSSQDLKEKILDQPDEACPTNIPAVLLAQLSDKQGEGGKKDNLTGVSQAGTILRDLLYHTALSSALGPTIEDRALIPETEARPADVLIPKCFGRRDTHCNTFGPARLMLGDRGTY